MVAWGPKCTLLDTLSLCLRIISPSSPIMSHMYKFKRDKNLHTSLSRGSRFYFFKVQTQRAFSCGGVICFHVGFLHTGCRRVGGVELSCYSIFQGPWPATYHIPTVELEGTPLSAFYLSGYTFSLLYDIHHSKGPASQCFI